MDEYMNEYYENIDEDDISDLLTESEKQAIYSEAKSCYDNLKSTSSKFFSLLDNDATKAISKLKSCSKDTKIKASGAIKKAIAQVNKEIPDMLTSLNKYTRGTKYGKVANKVATIAGWTVPPLIPIAGASEVLFAASEILNYLIEFQRRWTGQNRSAINDFIVACSQMNDKINADTIGQEKTCNNAIKLFRQLSSIAGNLIDSVMIGMRGEILKGYNKVYKGAEKAGKNIDNATSDTKSEVGKKANKFGKKLTNVSKELADDSKKGLDAKKDLDKAKAKKAIDKINQEIKKAKSENDQKKVSSLEKKKERYVNKYYK